MAKIRCFEISKEKLEELYNSGLSTRQIGKKYSFSDSSVIFEENLPISHHMHVL